MRPVSESVENKWFKWQEQLLKVMGTMYADAGQVRVHTRAGENFDCRIKLTCDLMQRGDIVRPLAARPTPAYHDASTFDPFAPPSGKKLAMIVTTKHYGSIAGSGTIVYVNLGSAQGVQVGDYFRVFRYQGRITTRSTRSETRLTNCTGTGVRPSRTSGTIFPGRFLGEGLVLRTGQIRRPCF